ncbi:MULTISPECIES: helix-turn-helix transcriptional regulator [Streptomyces]|uniref:helix-turn-helix transcriptional regulator n=1 Tax=Streptomyces TaxID=1883 RepID=UPI00163C34E4|nr:MULTISPECIES: helix-turn-helix transcriptional regulator [Streptomyces]MBC2877541.1 helix-turn-helix transcriptional regulator [Streptomyces sp. TYQ1024]UBI36218.1 helix-turn-helix transcriptional regulator [Streptomyces mobaraensis]UKW28811.1 helix-turn-helix transcriptional regulator [Streptomyces sp. TYQ1024]
MPGAIGPAAVGDLERGRAAGQRRQERSEGRSGGPGAAVEAVTGAAAVADRLTGLRRRAVEEVCALVKDRPWVDIGCPWVDTGTGHPVRREHPVRHRTVVDRAGSAVPVPVPTHPGAGTHQVRIADRVPAELFLADRREALLVLPSGSAGPAALVVGDGELLDSLVALFETVWHEARPLPPVEDAPLPLPSASDVSAVSDVPDATDLAVLSLLLSGLTDASVAKQLGLGLRTVQRRVKRLMELAGVTTRLQLGWKAAERGWTTGGPARATAAQWRPTAARS